MGAKPQKRRKGETRSGAPLDRHINTQPMRNNYKEDDNLAAYIKKSGRYGQLYIINRFFVARKMINEIRKLKRE